MLFFSFLTSLLPDLSILCRLGLIPLPQRIYAWLWFSLGFLLGFYNSHDFWVFHFWIMWNCLSVPMFVFLIRIMIVLLSSVFYTFITLALRLYCYKFTIVLTLLLAILIIQPGNLSFSVSNSKMWSCLFKGFVLLTLSKRKVSYFHSMNAPKCKEATNYGYWTLTK